jgi:HK97 family phage portal protein
VELFGFTIGKTKALTVSGASALQSVNPRGGWTSLWRVLESFAGAWQSNVEVTLADVLSHPIVYACISLISSDIGKMGGPRLVALGSDGVWLPWESPSFTPVLRKPNRYQNRIQFYEHWMMSKLSYGNTYVLKVRDNRGVVTSMFVLDPQKVTPLVAPNGDVYYELTRDDLSDLPDSQATVPASEIIHDRMNCLYHPLVGIPPIHACGLAATMGLKIIHNSAKLFANGSRPSGILTYPGDLKQESADRIQAAWQAKFGSGTDNTTYGEVALMAGGLTYQPIAVSAADSQLKEQGEWVDRLICSAFGIPPYMVGVGPAPLNNNMSALKQHYYDTSIMRHSEAIELCVDEGFNLHDRKHDGMQYGTEFDIEKLLRMDQAAMMTTIQEGVKAGVLKPNEGRLMLNRGPVEGGDSAYLQQQNFSLEALAKRDAQPDPFGTSPKPPAPEPTPEPDPVKTISFEAFLMKKSAELAEENAVQSAA